MKFTKLLIVIISFFSVFLNTNLLFAKDAWIGFGFQKNNTDLKQKYSLFSEDGYLVTSIFKSSPADISGLKAGDIFLSINGIEDINIKEILGNKNPGDILDFKILNNNKQIKIVKLILGDIKDKKNNNLTKESEKFKLYYAGYFAKFPEAQISEIYLSELRIVEKYNTKNLVITCLDKKSDLYIKGVRLYDQVLKINGQPVHLYKFSNKPFDITIERDSKILTFKNINPSVWINGEEDLTCVPEYAHFICEKFFGGNLTKADLWVKVYECCEKNKVALFPFEEKDNNFLRLASLDFAILYLKSEKKFDTLEKFIRAAEKDLEYFDQVIKKFPNSKIPDNYYKISEALANLNLFGLDFKDKKEIPYNVKNNISRITKLIDVEIKSDGKSIESLKKIEQNIYYLIQERQYEYLQKILPVLIDKNYSEDSEKYLEIIGSFYLNLAQSYYDQFKINNQIKVLSDAETWIKKKRVNAQSRVLYAKILTTKSYNFLGDTSTLNTFKTRDWKFIDAYINEFYLLSKKEQEEILKLDDDYLFQGYLPLGIVDSLTPFSGKHYSYYLNKGLEELSKIPNFKSYKKIYFITNLLMAASTHRDTIEINKNLFELKKAFIDAKGNDEYLNAISHTLGTLVIFFSNSEFFYELDSFVNFIDNNFDFSKKFKRGSSLLNLGVSQFYFLAKSTVEKNKNNYLKAAYYIEEFIKVNELNLSTIINDVRNNNNSNIYHNIFVSNMLPDLYFCYYKIGAYDKINNLTFAAFGKNTEDLKHSDLEEILSLENPIRVFSPLFSYLIKLNHKEKANMTARFLKKNFNKIIPKQPTDSFVKSPSDFTNNGVEFIKNNEKELAYDLYTAAYKLVLEKYNDQLFTSIWRISNKDQSSVIDFFEGYNILKSKNFFDQAYTTAQIVKNANPSREILKGYLTKKDNQNKDLIEYGNLEKELISLIKMEELELTRKKAINQEQFQKTFNEKKNKFEELEKKIKIKNPEYFQSIKIQGVSLENIQKMLKSNQAVIDYYFSQNKMAAVIIKKESYHVHIEAIDSRDLNKIKNNIRQSLTVKNDGKLVPYDLNNAFKLNTSTFLNLKKYLQDINYLFISPDGPLNEIPLHALPKNYGTSCMDCSSVEWNFSDYTFNYMASLDYFQGSTSDDFLTKMIKDNFGGILSNFEINKNLNIVKENASQIFGNIFKPREESIKKDNLKITKTKYLGIGDPDLYLKKKNSYADKFAILRSTDLSSNIGLVNISEIYSPLKNSREEIIYSSNVFGKENSVVLLKENATETKIKELNLKEFNIIHFATHAEVSGALKGLNEPFLVMSPPKVKTDQDNGLLMMNEIMQLNLNADLVILSACNTGSVEDQYSGSFSGLAKAFFVAGAKSVLVSNWYVEDAATQKLVKKFTELSANNQDSFANNLNLTMKELSKQNGKDSHPIFWAPFVFVGQDTSTKTQ